MNLSELFIRRPVTTTLIMLGIVVFGVMAYRLLPVSDLPNIDFPTIQVTAGLPGASPETMASAVALPLEKQFATIAGVTSINSASNPDSTSITIQFDLSRNIDAAAQDVQAMIAKAARQLPAQMPAPPSLQKVNPADQPVLMLGLNSPILPLSLADEYAQTLTQRISMVSGVASVTIAGSQKYAVRIDVDPRQLASHGIGLDEVASAVAAANVNLPTGTIYGADQTYMLQANGQLLRAAGYAPMIIAYRKGNPVTLGQVARVYDGVENDRVNARSETEGAPPVRSLNFSIQKQPGTNTVAVVDAVKQLLPTFRAQLPRSEELILRWDRSEAIRASVRDVKFTLALTVGLVVLVIFLFLRNISATLIPSLALPTSIIATFAVMYQLGYSLDNLSLMALTLSVGFVVDDAIVMLENIVRHMEMGKSPMVAAFDGSKEVAFTILSMTLSLTAVFIPVLFMGGIVGRLLHEFAVTIGVAILVSGFVSISLTPMLCSRFLKPPHATTHGRVYNAFERVFDGALGAYDWTLRQSLRFRAATLALSLVLVVGTGYLFTRIPKGFLPTEDTGRLNVSTEAVQGATVSDMLRHHEDVSAILRSDPNIHEFDTLLGLGGGTLNQGRVLLFLKPRGDRMLSADQLMAELRPKLSRILGLRTFMSNPPPISIGGLNTRSQYQFTLQDTDTEELYQYAPVLEERMRRIPGLVDVSTDMQIKNPQLRLDLDRNKIAALGLTVNQIETALYNAYGTRQVSTIYAPNNQYQVIMQVAPEYQRDPSALSMIYVRSPAGVLVPLNTVATVGHGFRPADGEPRRSAAVGHRVLQPQSRLGARRCRGGRAGDCRPGPPVNDLDELSRDRASLSGVAAGTRPDSPHGDRRDLSGPRHPVRELYASTDDSLGPAVGGVRGARGADDLPHGAERVRLRRRDHARRPRQEERHHDGRLRRRRRARTRAHPNRGHPPRVSRAVSSDHDDDDGGAGGDGADRSRVRGRRRIPAPAWDRGGGRAAGLPAADPVHHAGLLRVHRERPPLDGGAWKRTRIRTAKNRPGDRR